MSRLPPGQGLPNPNARSQQGGYNGLPQGYPPNRQPNSGFNPAQGMSSSQGYPSRGNAPPAGYPVSANYDASRNGANRDPREISMAQPPPPNPAERFEKSSGSSNGWMRGFGIEKLKGKPLQQEFIYSNLCAVSPRNFRAQEGKGHFPLRIRRQTDDGSQKHIDYIVEAKTHEGFPENKISLSQEQRLWLKLAQTDILEVAVVSPSADPPLSSLVFVEMNVMFASEPFETTYDEVFLTSKFAEKFDKHTLAPGQRILMFADDHGDVRLLFIVKSVTLESKSGNEKYPIQTAPDARGSLLLGKTKVSLETIESDSKLTLNAAPGKPSANAILAPDFKFEDMGIGGLDKEFSTIFRRAFASRVFDRQLVADMGINHVKGMLLYGPPGTGKTLIARQIGKMLKARPPKVINGPEVLNKYVGQSEENIRKMFGDAEKEYKEKGDRSGLHIIIFDELDAVCKQRGSGSGGGTGVGDSVVNQLLSKLDGVDQLNNILLIGMTNRKDMIDDALLRPGRLEVHIEISLPDEAGRLQILNIHTSKQRKGGRLGDDVDLENLASLTKNFSGAELYGLVRSATSFAFSRHTEVGQMANPKDVANIKVQRDDFMQALGEVRPAYGVSEADLKNAVRLGIMTRYSTHVNANIDAVSRSVRTAREDPHKFSTSVLFHGPKGSGKTALAAHIAMMSDFPFVKMIRPVDLAGYKDEFAKRDHIHKAFADAWKSPASILILDDFERLIGWSPIGPRYSSTMVEILTTLVISEPPRGHRLVVFATTSQPSVLRMLEVDRDFAKNVAVPAVSNLTELEELLDETPFFDSDNVPRAIEKIREFTPSGRVDVGIKTIFDCIFEAQNGVFDVVGTFADLMSDQIQATR
ncbi:vesicle-fusing ATPase [Geosmithia morbida]|uniref:Vesicular-fusion protein SEC18 n=1 Tax=Geosmithia morbida TaxID=1094350 RepID=A0A9P4Z288_9HYPO|nr:vesicle-fusing ATPase [Geosmithia morbida]KAF4126370.1 vesicle-fusing ATPase [Geosmithia morbida]